MIVPNRRSQTQCVRDAHYTQKLHVTVPQHGATELVAGAMSSSCYVYEYAHFFVGWALQILPLYAMFQYYTLN